VPGRGGGERQDGLLTRKGKTKGSSVTVRDDHNTGT
jgi:hypothetical protein